MPTYSSVEGKEAAKRNKQFNLDLAKQEARKHEKALHRIQKFDKARGPKILFFGALWRALFLGESLHEQSEGHQRRMTARNATARMMQQQIADLDAEIARLQKSETDELSEKIAQMQQY